MAALVAVGLVVLEAKCMAARRLLESVVLLVPVVLVVIGDDLFVQGLVLRFVLLMAV